MWRATSARSYRPDAKRAHQVQQLRLQPQDQQEQSHSVPVQYHHHQLQLEQALHAAG